MSMPASAMKTRASANSPTSAIVCAELHVRRGAEQCRCAVRDHGVLVQELAQHAIGLQHAGAAPVLQPGAALIDPAQQQRCGENRQQRLEHAEQDVRGAHSTNASSATSVAKL
jgi:hypothetical protein